MTNFRSIRLDAMPHLKGASREKAMAAIEAAVASIEGRNVKIVSWHKSPVGEIRSREGKGNFGRTAEHLWYHPTTVLYEIA